MGNFLCGCSTWATATPPLCLMSSRSPSPGVDGGDALFQIDDTGRESPGGFVLDTRGDELFASTAALPPTLSLAFLNHDQEASPETASPQGLVLPKNARVTNGTGGKASVEDEEDRYYDLGGEEKDRPALTCAVCGEEGHLMRKCPHKRCLTCGAIDEHSTYECPTGILCHKCGLTGHRMRDCTYRGLRRHMCSQCRSAHHTATACPTRWRIYAYLDFEEHDEERKVLFAEREGTSGEEGAVPPNEWDPATRWCCNCAAKGNHWGDDCTEPRRMPQGDWSSWSEVGSRTGPFAQTLPPPPKLAQSVNQRGMSGGMGDLDSNAHGYPARKRPHMASAPQVDEKRALLDRTNLEKLERVPYSVLRDDRQRVKAKSSQRSREPTSGGSKSHPNLDYRDHSGKRGPGFVGRGSHSRDHEPDGRAKEQSHQLGEVKKKSARIAPKSRPTGTKKHQPPPPKPRSGKHPFSSHSRSGERARAPQFGRDEHFVFTFSQSNARVGASGISAPLPEAGAEASPREGKRRRRKKVQKQTKAAQSQSAQKSANNPQKTKAHRPRVAPNRPKADTEKSSKWRSQKPKKPPTALKKAPLFPPSSARKKCSRAPVAARGARYHGSLLN